jgi:hypothetical protein
MCFYAVQYTITASSKLLHTVFNCLQERSGAFSPLVCEQLKTLSSEFRNVFITAAKSGKLQKRDIQTVLGNVIKLYAKEAKFMQTLDSWGGQSNMSLYIEKFINENDEPTCSLKVTPPKCIPVCQLSDVYFAKFQNCPILIAANCKLSPRVDYKNAHSHASSVTSAFLQIYDKICMVCCHTNSSM